MTSSDPSGQRKPSQPWTRYRLSSQQAERSLEGHRPEGASPFEDQPPETPKTAGPAGRLLGKIGLSGAELLLIVLSALGLLVSIFVLLRDKGLANTGLYALIALVPLGLVVWVLFLSDRLAPPPFRYLVFAVLWGAGIATFLAAIINSALYSDFVLYLGDVAASETLAGVAVAPVSEEVLKGAGVAIILLMSRRFVVSVSGGILIGGLAGAGFAFTENLIYFADAHSTGSALLGATVFGRAVMSPFIHPLATSLTGMGLANAILAGRGTWSWIWRPGLGLLGAVAVHAMWNGIASLGLAFLPLYVLVELPLFAVWLVWILRRPRKTLPRLRSGLTPYEATGWLSSAEVWTVCDMRARKNARRWARKTSKLARKEMRRYLVNAGRLGLEQDVIQRLGPARPRVLVAQQALSTLLSSRELFMEQGAIVDSGERAHGGDR